MLTVGMKPIAAQRQKMKFGLQNTERADKVEGYMRILEREGPNRLESELKKSNKTNPPDAGVIQRLFDNLDRNCKGNIREAGIMAVQRAMSGVDLGASYPKL